MGKIAILIFLVFLAMLGFFAVENKDIVSIKVPFGSSYEIPKIALILLSTTLGALTVLIIFFIRDTKRVIDNLQYQKRQKRDAKIQEFYSKALNAILGNKEEEAKEALKEILKEEPEHVDALLRLGDISLSHKDYKSALEYYKKAKDANPENLQALLSIETVMEKIERYDDALKYLDDILDIDPENLTALYRKRAILEKKDMWDDLLSLQKAIIKLEHSESDKQRGEQRLLGYKYEYARASLESGELEKAEKAFRTMIKLNEGFVPAYLGLAEVILTKGETEEAINFLEKSYDQLKSIIILARLEDLLINVGEPGRLIRFYRNAIAKNPQDNGLRFLLGKLYYRLEMVDDAMEILNSIDTNVFSVPELFSLRGELYIKRNQIQKALDELKKACGIRRPFRIQYCCSNCGLRSEDWSGRCPQCMEWNTYRLDVYGTCKA
ncbi:tetratricopeptide repeat domain protein [Dissulfurispira thermophila]|uniref:Tetratricopeptide repeat domain protein n=2 Tax=root TaxID=1 RepID=A0A7G1H4P0_9BACT|nr:tetratricopeptide repeat protein [Dissulfurispira thermophila]BCB97179.1 tetratricopeptide repeat domain protein [Dissulfurispira thermophila]